MLARLSAFLIWALVAATAVFWGLRLLVRAPAAPTYAVAVGDAAAVRGDLTRLLGAAPVAAQVAVPTQEARSRFRLLGIMAPKYVSGGVVPVSYGVALIAVDGKMPKAYAVGSRLDGDLMLQSVSLRTASIASGQGAPTITLELPPLATPATGTLNAAIGDSPAVSRGPMVVPQYIPTAPPQTFVMPNVPQPAVPTPVNPAQTRPDSSAPVQ